MSFELYYGTRDPGALAIHNKVMADRESWQKDVYAFIKEWGFDGYRALDFRAPSHFLIKKTGGPARKGPEIEGFKGGDLVYGKDGGYFEYTLHGRHPLTKERNQALTALHEKHEQPESGLSARSASGIICERLGVMHENLSGNRLILSHVWKIHDGELCIQVPVEQKDGVWILPKLPDIWTELTTSEMVERFNRHNAWAKTEDGCGSASEDW